MKTIIAGLLASTAVLRMMSDEGAGGTAAATDRQMAIGDAVSKLDDADDSHWLDDGRPRMEAVEATFGDTTPTREEVDKVGRVRVLHASEANNPNATTAVDSTNAGAGADLSPVKEQPKQSVTPGRMVTLRFPDERPFDGATVAAGVVVNTEFDDGSINVKAFAPNGGADVTFTGVRYRPDVEAMDEGADKNAAMSCTWDWPARA